MNKIYIGVAWSLLSLSCSANDGPAVGLLEQVPVIGKGYKVTARPIYIFTNKKLTEPTIFTGMVGTEKPYLSVCCYQVKDTSPLELKKEIAKYSQDDEFREHFNSIRGYKYIYAAQPLSDKSKWTSLMSTIMQKSADPEDGSPFSAPVIAATYSTKEVPVTISDGKIQTALLTRYDEKSDRMIFTFQQGKDKIEFSEPTFAD